MKKITFKNRYSLIALCSLLLITSCAPKIPFTQKIRDQYKLTEEDMKNIQFYTSGDIILTRSERTQKEKGTEEGTLIVKSGKETDQVVLRAGTPGLVDKVVDGKKIAVSFESDGSFLIFGDASSRKGPYTLLAAEWNNKKGKLKYGNEIFYTGTSSSNVYLTFKMKKLHRIKKSERVVGGRKL